MSNGIHVELTEDLKIKFTLEMMLDLLLNSKRYRTYYAYPLHSIGKIYSTVIKRNTDDLYNCYFEFEFKFDDLEKIIFRKKYYYLYCNKKTMYMLSTKKYYFKKTYDYLHSCLDELSKKRHLCFTHSTILYDLVLNIDSTNYQYEKYGINIGKCNFCIYKQEGYCKGKNKRCANFKCIDIIEKESSDTYGLRTLQMEEHA
jgi:hypothetical protein